MLNALAAVAAARAIGVTPSGAIDVHFSAMRGERVALGIGALVINDCYNANPLSMRAALDDLASQHAEGRRVAVLGDMLELGPAEREHHREIGAYAASAGVDLLVTVGPRATAMLDEFDGDSHAVLNAGEAAALLPELVARRATSCWSRARAASGSRSSPRRCRPPADGRSPDRGDRVPAHVHLPVAEVHLVPARARVRPAHPRGRAAGAPRQGRHADDGRDHHLHGDRGAVPAADGVHAARDRRLRRRARLRAARLRRRLHEDRQAAVPGAAGAHEAHRDGRHLGRAVARRHALGRAARHRRPARDRRPHRPRLPLSGLHLHRAGGHDVGGQPHRRARRAGRRLRRDRAARLHRDHLHDAPVRPRAGRRRASSAPASASSGSTPSRPRSSWATRALWGWGARSRGSR